VCGTLQESYEDDRAKEKSFLVAMNTISRGIVFLLIICCLSYAAPTWLVVQKMVVQMLSSYSVVVQLERLHVR
jgi:hypothetical protein